MNLDAASVEAAKVQTIWADDVFLNTAIGKPDAKESEVMSEDVSLERDLDMVMLIEAKMKFWEVLRLRVRLRLRPGDCGAGAGSSTTSRLRHDFETFYDSREELLVRDFIEVSMTEYVNFEDRTVHVRPAVL